MRNAARVVALAALQNSPIGSLFRVFLIPADLAGYRRIMHVFHQLASEQSAFAQRRDAASALLYELHDSQPGILCSLIYPALSSVLEAVFRDQARNAYREVLIAATQQRLATGSLPRSVEEIAPQWLPQPAGDPFTGTSLADREPLRYQLENGKLSVWSVGSDGEDDGGPGAKDNDPPNRKNDDIGLTMSAGG